MAKWDPTSSKSLFEQVKRDVERRGNWGRKSEPKKKKPSSTTKGEEREKPDLEKLVAEKPSTPQ